MTNVMIYFYVFVVEKSSHSLILTVGTNVLWDVFYSLAASSILEAASQSPTNICSEVLVTLYPGAD